MGLPIRLDALGERLGPLPVWGWAGIAIAGGVALVMLMPKRSKAPTMAATAPAGPEMPFEPQGVPGYQDSSYGGSGSYTAVQTYVCPDGRVSFDPSQCHGVTPPPGDGNPPPDPSGSCDSQFPLKRFPPGSKGGAWSGARPVEYWLCLVSKGCVDSGRTLPYCRMFQANPSYRVEALDSGGKLIQWRPSGSNNGDASPRIQDSDVSSLYRPAVEMPLPGYRYAMPEGNPRGTGI